ncbi:lipoprotein NlpI [Serratia fonticola]|uniref:tetratricopeptide repeat protein n=1 Tax=Serratia fonticola TaxID=47917 RepID=UPI00041F524F|nr:tetratricopeptide repeat protein [Serratia fonticola]CAI1636999.1 lipoprotein NlpI [Serratia fonticola]
MVIINKVMFSSLLLLLLVGCQGRLNNDNKLDENEQEYILSKVNNYQGLLKLYREKLSKKEDPEVRFKLAEYYNLVEDYGSSLHYLAPLLDNKPSDKIYLLQAKNLAAMGKDQEAQTAISAVLELNPKNGEAYNRLGVLQAQRGEFDAALQSFNTARALFVPEEQVVNNLAMLMILMENYEQAYNYLMPIYFRGHSTDSILHNLIFVLVKMQNYEEAANLIRVNSLNENPDELIAGLMRTRTRIKSNNTVNAMGVSNSSKPQGNLQKKSAVTVESNNQPKMLLEKTPTATIKPVLTQSENVPAIGKLVQPPPIISRKSGSNNKGVQRTELIAKKDTRNLNEVTGARFGTHTGFSRLTLESVMGMNFERVTKDGNVSLQVVLNNTRQSDNIKKTLSRIKKNIGNKHRDLKAISIEPKEENSLLVTIHFTRNLEVNIFRLPSSGKEKERLVFDFI